MTTHPACSPAPGFGVNLGVHQSIVPVTEHLLCQVLGTVGHMHSISPPLESYEVAMVSISRRGDRAYSTFKVTRLIISWSQTWTLFLNPVYTQAQNHINGHISRPAQSSQGS